MNWLRDCRSACAVSSVLLLKESKKSRTYKMAQQQSAGLDVALRVGARNDIDKVRNQTGRQEYGS